MEKKKLGIIVKRYVKNFTLHKVKINVNEHCYMGNLVLKRKEDPNKEIRLKTLITEGFVVVIIELEPKCD